jgi:hypothetical protein
MRERQTVLSHWAIEELCFSPDKRIPLILLPIEEVDLSDVVRINVNRPLSLVFPVGAFLTRCVSGESGTTANAVVDLEAVMLKGAPFDSEELVGQTGVAWGLDIACACDPVLEDPRRR